MTQSTMNVRTLRGTVDEDGKNYCGIGAAKQEVCWCFTPEQDSVSEHTGGTPNLLLNELYLILKGHIRPPECDSR